MANIARISPFEDLFDEMTRGFWVRPLAIPGETELRMKLEVEEDDKAFTVRAEIPGVRKEDIQIDVSGDLVSIRAEVRKEKEEKKGEKVIHSERSYGMVSRRFALPSDVDSEGTRAGYKDGLLTVTLPKKASTQAKRVSVS